MNIWRVFGFGGTWFFAEPTCATQAFEILQPMKTIKDSYLTHLPSELFEFNPNLNKIELTDSQISSIGANIFDAIEDLKELELEGNECISTSAFDKDEEVETFDQKEMQNDSYPGKSLNYARVSEIKTSGHKKARILILAQRFE